MIRDLADKVVRKLARTVNIGASPSKSELIERVAVLEAQLALSERHHTNAFWKSLDKVYDLALADRVLRCTVCGHSAKRDGFEIRSSQCQFGGGKLERYACPSCECVFGAQKFLDQDDELIGLDYQLLYSRYKEGRTTSNEVRTFESLAPEKRGVYVNWGCGAWNGTVERLRNEGWNAWGYESSATTASAFIATRKDALPPTIAGIFSNNVVEHFLDPVAQFEEFHALLPPGGRMAHSSPCYEYRYEFTRFHTIFLLGKSPEVLAQRTGFEVVDRTQDGEYINLVFQKR